jgi:hypothetical protein
MGLLLQSRAAPYPCGRSIRYPAENARLCIGLLVFALLSSGFDLAEFVQAQPPQGELHLHNVQRAKSCNLMCNLHNFAREHYNFLLPKV